MDINNDGLDLGDLNAEIDEISFLEDIQAVGIRFVSGTHVFFYNQTEGAAISSVEDLVSNAATQIQLA